MRIRWLRKALRNMDEEVTYIAEDVAAARLVAPSIFQAVERLVDQPSAGRPGRVPGTRELVVRNTRYVPYRVRGDAVDILQVFDTSRRLPTRW
jgi:plasmid stabilization system protein ParE